MRVVKLSVAGAGYEHLSTRLGRNHHEIEAVLQGSSARWTLLRPNGFMQNFLNHAQSIGVQGVFFSPGGPEARVSHVDVRDVAEATATVLQSPGHEGNACTLTGPVGISDDDAAATMSRVLDRPVSHQRIATADVRTMESGEAASADRRAGRRAREGSPRLRPAHPRTRSRRRPRTRVCTRTGWEVGGGVRHYDDRIFDANLGVADGPVRPRDCARSPALSDGR